MTYSTFSPQDDQSLEDSKTLGDCGFTNQTARPQAPATVGLAFRINGMFNSFVVGLSIQDISFLANCEDQKQFRATQEAFCN